MLILKVPLQASSACIGRFSQGLVEQEGRQERAMALLSIVVHNDGGGWGKKEKAMGHAGINEASSIHNVSIS